METLRSWRFWLGITLSLVCLWLALRAVPFGDFMSVLQKANYLWLVPAVLIQFLAVWGRAVRWSALLDKKGIVKTAFWAQSIGFLFTNVFPLRMGEVARVVVMSERTGIPVFQVAATAIVERVLDVTVVVIGLILVLPWMHVPELVVRAGTTFGVLVLIALVILWLVVKFRQFSDRLLRSILSHIKFLPTETLLARWTELVDGLAPLTHLRTGGGAVLWTVISWIFSMGIYLCVMQAYQPNATLIEAIFMVVALALAITVPSSPGFIGVFQYVGQQALVLPFGGKYDTSTALAITMGAYIIYYLITTGLGVIGLWQVGQSFANLGRMITSRQKEQKA